MKLDAGTQYFHIRIIYKSGGETYYLYEVNQPKKLVETVISQIEKLVPYISFDGQRIYPKRIFEYKVFQTESPFESTSDTLHEKYPEGYKNNFEGEDITLKITQSLQTHQETFALDTEDFKIFELKNNIITYLRTIFREKPDNEVEVQNKIEDILIILDYDYDREKVTIAYGTTSRKPDFTLDSLKTTIEVKLCKVARDESKITDEINADIPVYKTRYENILFIVYDLGVIRDIQKFKKDIEEENIRVSVITIKH